MSVSLCDDRLRACAEFLWPSHEAVGLAEGKHMHGIVAEIGFFAVFREQRSGPNGRPSLPVGRGRG